MSLEGVFAPLPVVDDAAAARWLSVADRLLASESDGVLFADLAPDWLAVKALDGQWAAGVTPCLFGEAYLRLFVRGRPASESMWQYASCRGALEALKELETHDSVPTGFLRELGR